MVSNSDTFIKTYQTDSQAEGTTCEQLPDGGFMIVANEGAGRPVILRTDKFGNLKWQKTIQKYCAGGPFSQNSTAWNAFNTTDQGHFIYQFDGTNTVFDSNGTIIYSSYKPNANTAFGAMQPQGSTYLLPSCNGEYSGLPSVNIIYTYNSSLQLLKVDSFQDSKIRGKTLYFFANYITPSHDYIISGFKFVNKVWQWGNANKIFAAKFYSNGNFKETIIDSLNTQFSDQTVWTTNTDDSGMVLLCSRTDYLTTWSHPLVIKMDKNLNVVWQKEFQYGDNISLLHNMSNCSDGGFIMVGQIANTAYQNSQPFAIKIDKDGNEIWEKTFSFAGASALWYAQELSDGHYLFLGNSNGFGNEKLGTRIIFLKTDANGNL